MSTFIAIIEWDGQKPPSKYYRRLHDLALRSRGGDKDESVLARRQNMSAQALQQAQSTSKRNTSRARTRRQTSRETLQGVIFQEGAIICPSESLARTIAALAQRGFKDGKGNVIRAKAVKVGEVQFHSDDFVATDDDDKALARIDKVFGSRGRPEDESVWSVVCYEELLTSQKTSAGVANCPHCGGVRIRTREGKPNAFAVPDGSLFDAWVRVRFTSGHWESSHSGDTFPPALSTVRSLIGDSGEQVALALIEKSKLDTTLAGFDKDTALKVLDAVLVGIAHLTKETRDARRLEAWTRYAQSGANPLDYPLAGSDVPDLLDAAGALGAERTAQLALRLRDMQAVAARKAK